jgi:tRNA-dihydrouridine synthase B
MEMNDFWHQLPRPIIGLSPMDDVTDHAYREIQAKYGQVAVTYTEFTSVEGVCHGAEKLLQDFLYGEIQRPIVGQIYGTTPDFFRQTAIVLCALGFDGVDINMGCPAKNVAHSGAGAALIRTPDLAVQIIEAVKQGIEQWHNGIEVKDCPDLTPTIVSKVMARHEALPAKYQDRSRIIPWSVKTRVGFNEPVINEWIPTLLATKPSVIALHGRTLKQRYTGLANWDLIAEAAKLVHQTETLILGNGDIASYEDALAKIAQTGVDGVLIGRASWGNPFVFGPASAQPTTPTIFQIALEHAELYEQTLKATERYTFLPMRKNLGWYVRGFPQAAEVRRELFQTNSAAEVKAILEKHGLI